MLMQRLHEVKFDGEEFEKKTDGEETSVNVGDKKVTIKVQDNQESKPAGKRQLLMEG